MLWGLGRCLWNGLSQAQQRPAVRLEESESSVTLSQKTTTVCVWVCVMQSLLTFNINLSQPSIHSYADVLSLIKRVLHLVDLIGPWWHSWSYWQPTGNKPILGTYQTKMMYMKYDILVSALKGNKYSFELLIWPKAGPVPYVILTENLHSVLEIPLDRNSWRWNGNPPRIEEHRPRQTESPDN